MLRTALATNVANDEGFEELREAPRSRSVFLAADMQTGHSSFRVTIRNISSCGALIATPVTPPVGSYVTITRGMICVLAQVVRVDGREAALRFRQRIDETALLVAVGRPPLTSAH